MKMLQREAEKWHRIVLYLYGRRPGANHGTQLPSLNVLFTARQHCQTERMNRTGSKCNFPFHIMVAAPLCSSVWLCGSCCDPFQLSSAMATVDEKRKVDNERRRFQERWKLGCFFTETIAFAYFVERLLP